MKNILEIINEKYIKIDSIRPLIDLQLQQIQFFIARIGKRSKVHYCIYTDTVEIICDCSVYMIYASLIEITRKIEMKEDIT